MIFDITSYGMGLGLVMAGWVIGMVVSFAFSLVRRIATLA